MLALRKKSLCLEIRGKVSAVLFIENSINAGFRLHFSKGLVGKRQRCPGYRCLLCLEIRGKVSAVSL